MFTVIDLAMRRAVREALTSEGLSLAYDRVMERLRVAGDFACVADLAGVAELADAFGVTKSAVCNWSVKGTGAGDFPEPVCTLAMGKIYSLEAVQHWRAGELAT